ARGSRGSQGSSGLWPRVLLLVLGALVLVLSTAVADAAPGQPPAIRAAGTARASTAAAAANATACDPDASSLRPSGPPQVTAGSFMAKIRARGYLIAGVDQSTYHFGFLNPLNGKIEGFDIDMIQAVAKAIFGSPDKVEYKAISDAQRTPDILSGAVDIVAHTMTITCARLQKVDFSSVYFDAAQRVLVLKNSTARSLADLKGQKVCATTGSDSLAVIARDKAVPVAVPYWTDCLVLLQQGDVAAISTDDSILDGLAAQDPWTKLIGPRLTNEPYGLAISKQHPEFVRFVNAVLQQLRTNGQWAASYAHWVGPSVPAPPPALYGG
ncbi:MAG: glutamate ABC transporter substrate-binding protein, partial [Streptosporangiaceae bacterium]